MSSGQRGTFISSSTQIAAGIIPSPTEWELIAHGSASANITIPSGYKRIWIIGKGLKDANAEQIWYKFNNDGAAGHYNVQCLSGSGVAVAAYSAGGANVGIMTNTVLPANAYFEVNMLIDESGNPNTIGGSISSGGLCSTFGGTFASAVAIIRFDIFCPTNAITSFDYMIFGSATAV